MGRLPTAKVTLAKPTSIRLGDKLKADLRVEADTRLWSLTTLIEWICSEWVKKQQRGKRS